VVRKDIKIGDLVLKRKKNWENPGKLQEPWEGSYIAKETNMPWGFSFVKSNWRRIVVFVECRYLEEVLPLRIPKLVRFIFQHFLL
jgi:hypothetical protein